MSYCRIADCVREAARGGLCWAHVKRQQRGADLSEPIADDRTPAERVIDAGSVMIEACADDEDAYERAERAFLRACEAMMRARGWQPPGPSAPATPRPRRSQRPRRRALAQLDLPLLRPRAEG